MMLQKLKILLLVLVCTLGTEPVFGQDCTDFSPMIGTEVTVFNDDLNFAAGSVMLTKGFLKIVKTKSFKTQAPNLDSTVILGITATAIEFQGFLTLSVLSAPFECRSLQIETSAQMLIVDEDTIHDLLNAQFPMHRDNRFKIDTAGGEYIVSGRIKEITLWGPTVKLRGSCLKECEPFTDCKPEFTSKESNGIIELFNASNFVADSTDSYVWIIDDVPFSNDENIVHDFPSGTYHICLEIARAGCINPNMKVCREVTSFAKPDCEVNFTYELENRIVSFKNTSTLSANEADHFKWSFGDGGESDENDPVHLYEIGTYKVCIETASETCATDSVREACNSVTITGCQTGHVTMTPDGDGNADYVFMQAGSLVYDRNGHFVVEIQQDENWTGLGSSNEELPLGYYTIICKGGGTHNVTIIR